MLSRVKCIIVNIKKTEMNFLLIITRAGQAPGTPSIPVFLTGTETKVLRLDTSPVLISVLRLSQSELHGT